MTNTHSVKELVEVLYVVPSTAYALKKYGDIDQWAVV